MAAEKTSSRDIMMWAAGLLILLAGLVGFFYFSDDVMVVVRVVGLLVVAGVGMAVIGQTQRGREMFGFVREADVERRKVVWPNRQETLQTTLMVLVITIIVAIMLFLMDTLFGWIVRRLIGVSGAS